MNTTTFKMKRSIVKRIKDYCDSPSSTIDVTQRPEFCLKADAMKIHPCLTQTAGSVSGTAHQEATKRELAQYVLVFQLSSIGKKFNLIMLFVSVKTVKKEFLRHCLL